MNEWLYGEDGYYKKFREIGKEGDFFTAVSMTPFFGGAIGNKIYKETKDKKDISIVEIGAHKGYMIVDIIRWIYTIDRDFLKRVKFFIIEKSKEVANIQREFFKEKLKGEVEVEILSSLSELKSNYAFFVSNEIFDAFGANLYYKEKIAYVKNWQIVWEDASKEDIEFAKRYNFTKGEIPVGYDKFILELKSSAKEFDFLTFDYGEKFARDDFSIRIYYKHKTYPLFDEEVSLEKFFKKSDITYDVNFQYLIDLFEKMGINLVEFKFQGSALVDFGIINMLEEYSKRAPSYVAYLKEASKIKGLIAPEAMGERFKMLHVRLRK